MKSHEINGVNRRDFLKRGSVAGLGIFAGIPASSAKGGANHKVIVGVMGTSRSNQRQNPGRGARLAIELAGLPNTEVAYVCDVDERNREAARQDVAQVQGKSPKGVTDFRRILEDPEVDALVIAAPDHWHAPATILACEAGKHVYVEKPCSHNAREGELMVVAARKYERVVQLGTQRRSWPGIIEAVNKVRPGRFVSSVRSEIGRVLSAHCWYFANRPSIGHGRPAPVPEWLDFDLWQGPAPEREYRDNIVHYNWHWFWHWGTSELGNNGVHTLDVARWALAVDSPKWTTSSGGRFRYNDDQETPDTNMVTFDFGDCLISWEGRSWSGRTPFDSDYAIAFYGTEGSLVIRGANYITYDRDGNELNRGGGSTGNKGHLQNFVNAIRQEEALNADIEEGYKSSLLCHLGNIAYRTGGAIQFDPTKNQIVDNEAAKSLWSREYRPGWEPKV